MIRWPAAILIVILLLPACAGEGDCPVGFPAEETRVTALLPVEGGAWAGSNDGTLAFLDSSPTVAAPPDDPDWGSIRALAGDRDRLTVAAGTGIFRLDAAAWQSLGPEGDGAVAISLAEGAEGIWAGRGDPATGSGSLALAGGEAWTLHDFTTVIESASMVREVVADGAGGVWAATNAAGVVRRGPAGDWRLYDLSTGALRSDRVLDLALDPQGGVWAATDRGVARLTDAEYETFPETVLPDPRARSVAVSADAVWVGTVDGGIARLDRATARWLVMRPTRAGGAAVTHLALTDDGYAWAGTAGEGLLRVAPDGLVTSALRPAGGVISALAASGETLWVGAQGGTAYRLTSPGDSPAQPFQVVVGKDPVVDDCEPSCNPCQRRAAEEAARREAQRQPVLIPAGSFPMGSDRHRPDEAPQHQVYLDKFLIGRTEVSNADYLAFVRSTGAPPPAAWPGGAYPFGQADFPLAGLRHQEAADYCAWAGGRLPTEAEWEKAARGTDGRTWPWGNEWAAARANTVESGAGGPVAVGSFPEGASPYGALDMAGNLEEWVADYYQADYYSVAPDRNPTGPTMVVNRVRRGGSWAGSADAARTTYRTSSHGSSPDFRAGFRCAWD